MERFDRLLEEQQKAIVKTDKEIERLRVCIDEYKQLKTRLVNISECFSKDAIVPFSPRALVSARLIHTNEVLIYLGGSGDHFCEASTFQAISIIEKRIKRISLEIKQLEDQRKLLTDREAYTQKLVRGEQPHSVSDYMRNGDEFEIREQFDPEKEKEWQAMHKVRVNEERARERVAAETCPFPFRKVRFQDELPDSESSSDSSYLPDITVLNSSFPPRPVNPHITDWFRASPADVVAFVQNNRIITHQPPKEEVTNNPMTEAGTPTTKPFSRVIEHKTSSSNTVNSEPDRPISRFRLRRIKK